MGIDAWREVVRHDVCNVSSPLFLIQIWSWPRGSCTVCQCYEFDAEFAGI